MKILLLLPLALTACSGSARFAPPDWSPAAYIRVATPQPQYDHAYRGRVNERILPLAQTRRICAGHDACNYVKNGVCYIVIPIPREAPVKDLDSYRRWEIAGCNGHPDEHIIAKP